MGHELVVGTPLNDAAVLHHQDLVRALDGGQPMGDGKDGFPLCQSGQSLLNQVLILRVYAGGRFIKDDDRRVFEHGAGDGNALFLPAGEGGAALSNHGIIAVRQGRDEIVAAGGLGSGHHLFMGGVRAAELDVVLHRVMEQIHRLEHHGDVSQQALAGKLPHIVSAHGDRAGIHIIKPGN
ncbi:Zn-dependent peptidase ImmA, M78 family, partial [Dysosmobacter welbionis]